MKRPFRADVSKIEWRWVTFWASFLVLVTLIPYAWATIGSTSEWLFPGILTTPQDGIANLSKIRDGINGKWLIELRYTPTQHEPIAMFPFYLFLGHLARSLGFSEIVIFHLARIVSSMLMFTALYQLGATVWKRLRPRRLFFLIASLGSGVGWFTILLNTESLTPDITIPEAFPLYAAFSNPHFPLSFAMLAFLASSYLQAYRPGYIEVPSAENGGLNIIIYSVVLAIVHPPALIALGGGLTLFLLLTAYQKRNVPWHELRWFAMFFLPATPFLVYYLLLFTTNDTYAEFNRQYLSPSPNIVLVFLGYGLLFLIATPGIVRSFYQFHRDGDQLMLLWLIFNLIALYLPYALQSRFFIGLTIPIVYFAVRAIEDYWLDRIPARWHTTAFILMFVGLIPTNLVVMFLPIYGTTFSPENGRDSGILVDSSYGEVFDWFAQNGVEGEVVLAAPLTSYWIPVRSDLRVVYGHQFETVPAQENEEHVEDYYTGRDCGYLFAEKRDFNVDYVVWGLNEERLGDDIKNPRLQATQEVCRAQVAERSTLTVTFEDSKTVIYVMREPR